MEAGDYRRVWLLLRHRPVDFCEQAAIEDVMEAKALPYALFVDDDTPHIFDRTEHPDSDRYILMEQLADLMKEYLPNMGKGRGSGGRATEEGHCGEDDEEEDEEEVDLGV